MAERAKVTNSARQPSDPCMESGISRSGGSNSLHLRVYGRESGEREEEIERQCWRSFGPSLPRNGCSGESP
eukprot:15443427-Alexandrium_andersonii.AAC.1